MSRTTRTRGREDALNDGSGLPHKGNETLDKDSVATPPSTLGTRRSRRGAASNDTSAPQDSMDLDYLATKPFSVDPQPSRRVVKAVEVPSVPRFEHGILHTKSNTPSSVSSVLSVDQAAQHDFDTPATSAAPTPAENAKNGNLTRGLLARRIQHMEASPYSSRSISNLGSASGKRGAAKGDILAKANTVDDMSIALALQNAEYEALEDVPVVSQSGRKRRAPQIEEESDLSVLTSEMSSRGPSIDSEAPPFKKSKISLTRRPARDAKSRARQSMRTEIAPSEDGNDDDDDALESAFSAIEDSGAESLEPPEVDAAPPNNATGGSSIVRTRRPSRRGRYSGLLSRAEREREKLEKAHPEVKRLWEDLKAIPVIKPEQAAQPEHITRPLKSFQLEGLDWMCRQEKSKWKGGLLGDEMGMGKTIQAVSLIMSDYPAKDPTLVIVPPVALMQWASEIAAYTNGTLKVLIHHNTDPKVKKLTVRDLKKYDVVMISYSGLESMYRKQSKGWKRDDGLVKENSRIHAIKYHRLILDEAHNIKTRTTGVAKACFALKADYKWCLSGTPVQNRIGEFFSLLRFLEVTPFASYFCKSCSCAQLHWSQDEAKKCTHCKHSGFQHVSIFNQELLNPITSAETAEARKEAFSKLRLITDRIMLRRLKRNETAAMELPPKNVVIHNEFFGPSERDFSSSIMSNTARQFDTYVSRGVMLNNYANIFSLIMRMRQSSNHPDLILKRKSEGGANVLVCCICDEPAEEAIKSRCRHDFCRRCVTEHLNRFEDCSPIQANCPSCHITLAIDLAQPDIEQDEDTVKKSSIINRIKMEDWTSSTKIEMLIYDLYKLRSKKQTNKSIVFSNFTTMLQLLDYRLRRAGFNTVMLDGTMSPAQRQKSIEYFMNNVDVEVFLVSLKAGGVALNLTEASRVFIVDPWWNPAAEWQSADRCHRIGQKRPCTITRLCIEDSVESRMVMLQEKKANMIAGTVDNNDGAMERLSPEDMMFLFRGN